MYNKIADELKQFGGKLKCSICGKEKPLGNTATYLASGWPMCCGYTMTWITKNQLKENEQ
jgi:hypothetical protein